MCLHFHQEKLSGKNAEIEETRNLLSTKLDTISQLEQELANSRLELSEKEKRLSDISQAEVHLHAFHKE